MFSTLPSPFRSGEELVARTTAVLNEARELYTIAGELEDAGNSQKALEAFREVEMLAADFPGIRDDIHRTEQSAEMLSEINGTLEPGQGNEAEEGGFAFGQSPGNTGRTSRCRAGSENAKG